MIILKENSFNYKTKILKLKRNQLIFKRENPSDSMHLQFFWSIKIGLLNGKQYFLIFSVNHATSYQHTFTTYLSCSPWTASVTATERQPLVCPT